MTRLPDEYEQLATRLRQAAEREGVPRADVERGRRSLRSWVSRHTLATALVLVGIGGTATAAVLTLSGEPSGPMTGQLQGARSDTRYAIQVTPAPTIGQPGWCTTVTLRGTRANERLSGQGCGPPPTARQLETTGGIIGGGSQQRPQNIWLMYAVVDESVAGVRLHGSGRVVLSRRDPGIPEGTRIVVAELGRAEYGPLDRAPQVGWELLDRAGRELGSSAADPGSDLFAGHPSRQVESLLPAGAPCRITFRGGVEQPGKVRSIQLDAPVAGTPDLRGRALLACSRTTFPGKLPFTDDRSVTVFVDAASPGRPPMPLPGFVAGADGTGDVGGGWEPGDDARGMSAKRIGNAWVIAQGPTKAAQRALLEQVAVDVPSRR